MFQAPWQRSSVALLCVLCPSASSADEALQTADGYRGIWYSNQSTGDEHHWKYSGGKATYPHQHNPLAIYAPAARKTFFVYGGTSKEKINLLHMVSYYDHATGKVPRPVILLDKKTGDAHDNPVLQIDEKGFLWVFSNAHGTGRPSFIHRSRKPYDISSFELIQETNFSYGQPWHLPGLGFLFMHTKYSKGRGLYWSTSAYGRTWGEVKTLAHIDQGHYQVTWRDGDRIGSAFNYHPSPQGLNARTNLYYVETRDFGKTWRTADGKEITPPLAEEKNPALIHDFHSEGLLVYLKNLQFDGMGRPVALVVTTKGFEPGPKNGPRMLTTVRWSGETWEIRPVTGVDHNYDHGSLHIDADGVWRIIAPTEPGPQPWGCGGEVVLWTSRDQGKTWEKTKQLTRNSRYNHNYLRLPWNAHPDFHVFWADGNPLDPSESHLYFTDREGTRVRRLPEKMEGEFAEPEEVK